MKALYNNIVTQQGGKVKTIKGRKIQPRYTPICAFCSEEYGLVKIRANGAKDFWLCKQHADNVPVGTKVE